jgi:hypothetical protein
LVLVGVLSLFVASRCHAQAPPQRTTAAAVNALIDQLGDADFRKRVAASRGLEALGPDALPGLRKALGHPDPEVRRRVRDLIPVIETAAALAPRRVSLKMVNKPLRAVIDELTRQTGFKIEFWANNPAQTYSFDFKELTFWEALDRVCRDAGLILQQTWGEDCIRLHQQDGQPLHVRYEGAFRFVPTGLQQTRYLAFTAPARNPAMPPMPQETLTLNFSIFSEPRLPLLGVGEIKLDAAYDTEKNSMLPAAGNPDNYFDPRFGIMRTRFTARYGNGNRTFQMHSQFNLFRPSLKATGIKLIRGSVPVTLLSEQKPVVIADKVLTAKGKTVTVGTTTFRIEDVRETPGKQFQLRVSISEDNKDNPNDYTWINTLYQRIELFDEQGNRFQSFGSHWGNSGPGHVEMTLTFGSMGNVKMAPPAKFVFQQWTTLQAQIPFEFRDLPLP